MITRALPKLAIVGRPNVGKSALFNRIMQKRIAIVDEAEGVTRDRLYAIGDFFGKPFELIDTGGIHAKSKALFNEEIKRQAEIAIEEADSIILVVDGLIGLTALDVEVGKILLRTKKPVCVAVNKIDNLNQQHLIHEFHPLGIRTMVPVSAIQGWNIAELLEAAFADISFDSEASDQDNRIHISIVGRPNVGKSSLVNYLLDESRCIVSPIPGTTRDSIDIPFEKDGVAYTLIDTAGIRRKHAEHEVVDKFAALRTERAIERADVCLLMLDAQQGITREEKKIANKIEEMGKSCILLLNKWDLVKGFRMEHCLRGIDEEALFLKHCPKLCMSALSGRNVDKLFPLIEEVNRDAEKRITTHQLNKFIADALQRNHPPMILGRRLRIYYMTQVAVRPPKFILFVNFPNLMIDTYKKYLYNQFRETYGFAGVPIQIHLKGKEKSRKEHDTDYSADDSEAAEESAAEEYFDEEFAEMDDDLVEENFDEHAD